ncbi:hypothetical protein LPJ68_000716, partial [Coemansia sp. RSA 1086]
MSEQPAWSSNVALAWAQQQHAEPIADAEVQQLCKLCDLTTNQLQQLIEANLNTRLTFDEENTAWKLIGDIKEARVTELSKLIATFPRFLSWTDTAEPVDELSSDQRATVVKLARMTFAAASESVRIDTRNTDLLDPMTAVAVHKLATGKQADAMGQLQQIREIWSAEVAKLRERTLKKLARFSGVPERRSKRSAQPATGFYKIKANLSDDEAGKRLKDIPAPKRARQSAEDIQSTITATKEIIRVNTPSNRPDTAYLVRIRDFIPLVLPETDQEPSHAIVEPRVVKSIGKSRHQVQSLWEYAIDGYPAPVDAERWLASQRQKYLEWLQTAAGCKSVTIENVMQLRPCLHTDPYGAPMCRGCLGRQADMYCAFRDIRVFTKMHAVLSNGEEFTRFIMAPMFTSDAKAAKHKLKGSNSENWSDFYILLMTARTLQHSLDMISRVLCNADEQPIYNGTVFGEHPQFIRISQFTREDVQHVQSKVQQVLAHEHMMPTIDCCGKLDAYELEKFHIKIQQICQRTGDTHPHRPWELPVIYVKPGELSTGEFSRLWRRGMVVVVQGLLQALDGVIWQPDWWINNFGFEMVNVLDCSSNGQLVGEWPLRDFYRLFNGQDSYSHMFNAEMEESSNWTEHKAAVKSGILKLKDWPPAEDFQTRLPDHFANFMKALPFPEYTQRDGAFNLVNKLPAEFVPPDLGPKMYCAYGSNDKEGGNGTTNLHCDMADAVNIMAYAANSAGADADADAAAVWDIYPPEAIDTLRRFIAQTAANVEDAIHDQATYLTLPMRQAVYEQYGQQCYRIYQNPGDAVFVPAGYVSDVAKQAEQELKGKKVVVVGDVPYMHMLDEIAQHIRAEHVAVARIPVQNHVYTPTQQNSSHIAPGRLWSELAGPASDYSMLYIGEESPTLTNLLVTMRL